MIVWPTPGFGVKLSAAANVAIQFILHRGTGFWTLTSDWVPSAVPIMDQFWSLWLI
jgi:hypothetical protein